MRRACSALRKCSGGGAARCATPDEPGYEADLAIIHAQLDDQAVGEAWMAGRALSADRAIAYALEGREIDHSAEHQEHPGRRLVTTSSPREL